MPNGHVERHWLIVFDTSRTARDSLSLYANTADKRLDISTCTVIVPNKSGVFYFRVQTTGGRIPLQTPKRFLKPVDPTRIISRADAYIQG